KSTRIVPCPPPRASGPSALPTPNFAANGVVRRHRQARRVAATSPPCETFRNVGSCRNLRAVRLLPTTRAPRPPIFPGGTVSVRRRGLLRRSFSTPPDGPGRAAAVSPPPPSPGPQGVPPPRLTPRTRPAMKGVWKYGFGLSLGLLVGGAEAEELRWRPAPPRP